MDTNYAFIAQSDYWGVCGSNGNVLLVHGDGREWSWEAVEATEVGDEYWPKGLSPRVFARLQEHVEQWLDDQAEIEYLDECLDSIED